MQEIKNIGRVEIVLGICFLAFALLIGRLFYIQIIEHEKWAAMADGLQTQQLVIEPNRGEIYTRFGSETAPLVMNETVYTVFADPQQIANVEGVIEKIKPIAGEKWEAKDEALHDQTRQYVVLARGLDNEQNKMIGELDLDGVGSQSSSRRFYPEGSMLGQTLGFVNLDGKGQYGIEGEFDEKLTGEPGVLTGMTDIKGTFLPSSQYYSRLPAEDGESIVLTIDRNIQYEAEKILNEGLANIGASVGSILVMDPNDGKVLAMANSPSYDPGDYAKVTDANLFLNPIVSDPFEPGSVTKVFTTAAAIDSGAINKDSTFNNSDCIKIYDDEICNTTKGLSGTRSVQDILSYSLNTGVVWELEQMGGGSINSKAKNTLYNYFHNKFRFDKLTGIEQAAEVAGNMTKPDSAEAWDVRYANMTFGQGFSTTMVEMLSGFAAMINGGTYYKPYLLYGTLDDQGKLVKSEPEIIETDVVKNTTSEDMKQLMFAARNHAEDGGHYVGSKSGTAEIYNEATGQYIEGYYIGTHLGFGANAQGDVKYVIMVRVDDYKGAGYAGSVAAGPIFTAMSNYIINYEGISK